MQIVLSKVTNILRLGGLRPTIPADTVPEFSDLISKCWDSEPVKRPSFDEMYLLSIVHPNMDGG